MKTAVKFRKKFEIVSKVYVHSSAVKPWPSWIKTH